MTAHTIKKVKENAKKRNQEGIEAEFITNQIYRRLAAEKVPVEKKRMIAIMRRSFFDGGVSMDEVQADLFIKYLQSKGALFYFE